jgi:splicing factor 3A subunit 2
MHLPVESLARLKADYQDPYILRTHLGTLECRLCLTLHVNEGSYLAHTQGKKHQTNLARRAAQDNKSQSLLIAPAPADNQVKKKVFVKIGRPGKSQSR